MGCLSSTRTPPSAVSRMSSAEPCASLPTRSGSNRGLPARLCGGSCSRVANAAALVEPWRRRERRDLQPFRARVGVAGVRIFRRTANRRPAAGNACVRQDLFFGGTPSCATSFRPPHSPLRLTLLTSCSDHTPPTQNKRVSDLRRSDLVLVERHAPIQVRSCNGVGDAQLLTAFPHNPLFVSYCSVFSQ